MSDDGIPDFDDDPTIDTVYSLYQRSRTDLDPERKAAMEDHFDELGIKDIVQPCGYTDSIRDQFCHFYQEEGDFGALIKMLELYPVYGNQEISNELIRLLQKTRLRPTSNKSRETEELHRKVKKEFERINPKKGEVESAYMEVAKKFETTPANVRTIIRRAINNGWKGDFFNPFSDATERLHIIKRSEPDKT